MQCKTKGENAFFPMALETADDVPHMALIDLAVFLKHGHNRSPIGIKRQDLLLVFAGNLGIRDYERWDQGVGSAAETASDTLDDECEKKAQKFQVPCVMPIEDQTSTMAAFAFHHVDLQAEYILIINFL